jgi:hypothetical protein
MPHELPLDAELHAKYLDTARAAMRELHSDQTPHVAVTTQE